MPSHLLSDLSLPGAELVFQHVSDLHLYDVGKVSALSARWKSNELDMEMSFEVDLKLSCCTSGKFQLTLLFKSVQHAEIPDWNPYWCMSEVEIEDVQSSQLEGIRYLFTDHGFAKLTIMCREIVIVEFQPVASSSVAGQD